MQNSFYQQRLDDMKRPASVTVISPYKQYSKLKLETAIARLGKKKEFDAMLSAVEVAPDYTALEAWQSANVISDDYPGFEGYYAAALNALGISKEAGDALLESCISDS